MLCGAGDGGTDSMGAGAGGNVDVGLWGDEGQDAAAVGWQAAVRSVGSADRREGAVSSDAGRFLILWSSHSNRPPAAPHPFERAHAVRARCWAIASFSGARRALESIARKRAPMAARCKDAARSPLASDSHCVDIAARRWPRRGAQAPCLHFARPRHPGTRFSRRACSEHDSLCAAAWRASSP